MCQNTGKTAKIVPAPEESTRGKDSRLTHKKKRQHGTGYITKRGRDWVIRWSETELTKDGSKKRVFRYERVGEISRKEAADILAQRIAASANKPIARTCITFQELVNEWKATVLPMYKLSTRKAHLH